MTMVFRKKATVGKMAPKTHYYRLQTNNQFNMAIETERDREEKNTEIDDKNSICFIKYHVRDDVRC